MENAGRGFCFEGKLDYRSPRHGRLVRVHHTQAVKRKFPQGTYTVATDTVNSRDLKEGGSSLPLSIGSLQDDGKSYVTGISSNMTEGGFRSSPALDAEKSNSSVPHTYKLGLERNRLPPPFG